jgi:microcin C transport system substrate-binding protein
MQKTNFQMYCVASIFLSSFHLIASDTPKHQEIIAIKKQKTLTYLGAKPKHNFPDTPFSFANVNAPKGGMLKLATQGTFDGLNRFSLKGTKPTEVLPLLEDGLMYRSPDEPFTMYPLIAKEVEIADDSSFIIFHIDERAKFQNGSPITAEDVKATYEHLKKHVPRYKSAYRKVINYECIGNLSIKVTFEKQEDGTYDAEAPLVMSLMPVFPKGDILKIDLSEPSLNPLQGSGPYEIGCFEVGRFIELKRRENYWAKDILKGFYNFDTIRLDYYKNIQAQFQAFQAGEFDIFFETNPQNWNRSYHFDAVKKGKVKKIDQEHKRGVLSRYFILNMRRPLFQDPILRKALVLAFDANAVNKLVFENDMKIPYSTFANTQFAHKGKAEGKELEILSKYKDRIGNAFNDIINISFEAIYDKNPRTNIQKADSLLKEGGYLIQNGIRLTKDGKPLIIHFMSKDEKLEKIALQYKESLKKLGIELIIQKMDAVQYENRVLESDFDMIIHAVANSLNPGIEQVYYYSTKTADEKGSSNYVGFKNPVLNDLAYEIVKSKTAENHLSACRAMDRYLMSLCCFIPIMYDNKYRAAYWHDRFDIPPYDPDMGTNVIAFGWSKNI